MPYTEERQEEGNEGGKEGGREGGREGRQTTEAQAAATLALKSAATFSAVA
jgi:predicted transposase YdaD